jgi:hypothetical protein|tara:strand:- start:257 stop:520 length:264 start_codon:yes stop_codon:yes gene_type:complete
MKFKEMIEIIQQHHPDIGIVEIRGLINRAQDEFSARTRINESADAFPLVEGQRGYALDDHHLEIKSVDFDGRAISRLAGRPQKRDLT